MFFTPALSTFQQTVSDSTLRVISLDSAKFLPCLCYNNLPFPMQLYLDFREKRMEAKYTLSWIFTSDNPHVEVLELCPLI